MTHRAAARVWLLPQEGAEGEPSTGCALASRCHPAALSTSGRDGHVHQQPQALPAAQELQEHWLLLLREPASSTAHRATDSTGDMHIHHVAGPGTGGPKTG